MLDAERRFFPACQECREVPGVRVRGVASAVTKAKSEHFMNPVSLTPGKRG